MPQDPSKKRLITIWVIVGIILIGLIALIAFLARDTGKNQYGERIRIQNYDSVVRNISPDMRDSMEAYLYNIVTKNSAEDFDATTVKDAYIREASATQNYVQRDRLYNGGFIVDMESIKQSYQVQYSYSIDGDGTKMGGSPVVISCLPTDKLKYGEFKCTDFVSEESSANDVILQYLPFQNFSFKVSPDATRGDRLTLVTTLNISQIQLKGSAETRRAAVVEYKKMVADWITSKGADPADYDYEYNYDDEGNPINAPPRGTDVE